MRADYPTTVITGATGFVGRYVVERLLREKVNVRCVIRHRQDGYSFDSHPQLNFVVGDILEPESLSAAFKGADTVINIAGLREFWSKDRSLFYQLNHIGAKNVFEACLQQHVAHVVQVSTPLAYGVPKQIPFNEITPAGPHPSDYAKSKYLGDQAGLSLQAEKDLPLSIVYLAAVIGAGDDKETMEVRRAVKQKMPALVGADTQYTYLYVKDAAEAIVRTAMRQDTIGKRYLIGTERATTREYFDIIGRIANVKIPSFNIPENWLIPVAKVMEAVSHFTGKRPELPMDVLKTTQAGSLLFDGSLAERELDLSYTPLKTALTDAVADVS